MITEEKGNHRYTWFMQDLENLCKSNNISLVGTKNGIAFFDSTTGSAIPGMGLYKMDDNGELKECFFSSFKNRKAYEGGLLYIDKSTKAISEIIE